MTKLTDRNIVSQAVVDAAMAVPTEQQKKQMQKMAYGASIGKINFQGFMNRLKRTHNRRKADRLRRGKTP